MLSLKSRFRVLLTMLLFLAGVGVGRASEIPGLTNTKRHWVALLLEDHGGMREIVWDGAFNAPSTSGPFQADHRYALRTTGTPGFVDLGCWDQAWPSGQGWTSAPVTLPASWTADRSGVILAFGGRSTWVPVAGAWDAKGLPTATFRGAYLNWLLQNRGTTPSIPRETRWQRVQRGTLAVVRALLTRSGGAPEFRVVGIGTSGRLLIPPGEGLPAGENAATRMEPDLAGGPMLDALTRALETVRSLKGEGACRPGIVLPISDGWALGSSCASGIAYESSSAYTPMRETVSAIQATGQASVWAWSVDKERPWSTTFATLGAGKSFGGDAVAALEAAIRAWMRTTQDGELRLSLGFDQLSLTRTANVTLTINATHGLASATVNGQAIPVAGMRTLVPLTLREGLNTYTVRAKDYCGTSAEATASITLDTTPPRITLTPVPPGLTNATSLVLTGAVDDPTATLTLNGQGVALDATGGFRALVSLVEGSNAFAFQAVDPAGNVGRLDAATVRDTLAPIVRLASPAEGLLTNAPTVLVQGTVSDVKATLRVNGQVVPLDATGAFQTTLAPPEGPFVVLAEATDLAGNVGRDRRTIQIDRTAPVITSSVPALVNTPSLIFTGRVDDPNAVLTLNGLPLALDAAGAFTATAPLEEGANTLRLEATDKAGNIGRLELRTVRDTLAPVVHLKTPEVGLITKALTLQVTGQVDDLAARVEVNGTPVTLDATGFFSLELSPAEGPFELRATATDPAGNVGTDTRTVTIDRTAPVIRTTSFFPLATNQLNVSFTGQVDDSTAVLTMEGAPISMDAQGRFTFTGALPVEGLNSFTFRAVDIAGNEGSLVVSLLRDTCAPIVEILVPAEGLRTNAATVQVEGRVDDPLATVTLNGQSVALVGDRFSAPFSPAEGPFTITAQATDLLGNRGSATRTILVDRTAPRITLTKPLPPLTNQTAIPVQGLVDDPTASLTLNGVSLMMDANGAFSTRLTLAQGANAITFRAVDAIGNVGTLEASTVCDTIAPVVILESPSEGWITNQHNVMVKGRIDDPSASLMVGGQSLKPSADGSFETTISPGEGSHLVVALATDLAGNSGHATRTITLDWTPPALAWVDPTPAEGALLVNSSVSTKATVSETAAVSLNGSTLNLQQAALGAGSMPFWVGSNFSAPDGPVTLVLEAVDRAGNSNRLERRFAVGTGIPVLVIENPPEGTQTGAPNVILTGRVGSAEFLKPVMLTINGVPVSLDVEGGFSFPVALAEGKNTFQAVAINRFGGKATAVRSLYRFTTPFGIKIDWPLDGMATPETSTPVRGHVLRAGASVTVNGLPAVVDPSTLTFSAAVPLNPGLNTLIAQAQDGVGNIGRDQVHVTSTPATSPEATYRWDLPLHGSTSRTRTVRVMGQADLPGVSGVSINGQAMRLTGLGKDGRFEGDITLEAQGRNLLRLETRTIAGKAFTEQREVSFIPELPRIRLLAPDSARPGDSVSIQVMPDGPTVLAKADLSWNGRYLTTVSTPFDAVQAQVPVDAPVGSRIVVEALGTDREGATVTARSYVTVYGTGALMVEAYDDRLGLPFTDMKAKATVEGGESQFLDDHGRAALATALPQNWVRVEKEAFTPVWRSAGLTIGSAQSVMDARLTKLEEGQDADTAGFTGEFGGGTMKLTLPGGALSREAKVSATPLSSQGLPALLPLGWSAVSAWWVQVDGAVWSAPGSAALTLPNASPTFPSDAQFAWVHWDATQHAWVVLAAPLDRSALGNVSLPSSGGYALVVADPAPTAPPAAIQGSLLPAYSGPAWKDGIVATGSIDPSVLPTVEAINGARATAKFSLAFQDGLVVPSGTPIQADVLESYVMIDQALIEPDGFSQDAVASRWALEIVGGKPVLSGMGEGIGLRLPVRMSRTFGSSDLVEGHIFVGYYHDGVQVAQSGSELVGASGGTVSRDGISVNFAPGVLSGTTLVRLAKDAGDSALLWPELVGKGSIPTSFTLDVVGTPLAGMGFSLQGLQVPPDTRPLLLQRRVVQGERLVVAVGELRAQGSAWTLLTPEGGNVVLEGGSFAVLLPSEAWDWVSGTALLPGSLAQPLMHKLGAKARMALVKGLPSSFAPQRALMGKLVPPSSGDEVAVADVVTEGGYLLAASGSTGAFAVPVRVPSDPAQQATIKGARRDLGLTGSFTAPVPSRSNALRLATVPFRVMTIFPSEGAEVGVGSIVEILLSTPADPETLANAKLFREPQVESARVERIDLEASSVKANPGAARPVSLGKSAKGTKTIRPVRSAKGAQKPGVTAKHTMSLADDSGLMEVPVRRSLSQDGKSLLLTPETSMTPGAVYRVVTGGLASLSGEAAPSFIRRFKTQAQPQLPDADLSRIRLSYPTESFDVTVTIPEGSVPAWTVVTVEAPQMGSFGQGVMPPTGDLVFQIRASLGERLTITLQLRDGRGIQGHLSRYVSEDGRTTLGVDGGRVEGPNGLAIQIPAEALAGSVELSVETLTVAAETPEGALMPGETLVPALRIRASREMEFLKPPVLELPSSAIPIGADTASSPELSGNGPLAVFRKETRILPDGTTDEFHVLMDTAGLRDTPAGRKVVSLGGLRIPDSVQGTVVHQQRVQLTRPASGAPEPVTRAALPIKGKAEANLVSFSGGGLAGALLDLYLMGFPGDIPQEYKYHSGTVYRNWNGLGRCGGKASADCYGELPFAEVYRHQGTAGLDEARKGRLARGRMLATCDAQGRYMNVGGPMANAIPGQTWIALYAVDPRTGETSLDPGGRTPESLGLPWTRYQHSLVITSPGGDPFDPALTAPRIRAQVVDAQGLARTIYTVGEKATLRIFTETGSQPVVQGKASGSLTQNFGALPAEIPVTFTQEGTWKADILGWTAKPVQGNTSVSVIVTPVGVLGPSVAGKPRILAKEPGNGDKDIDSAAMIKITFSEPVRGATSIAFDLRMNETSVPFRVVSNGRDVTESTTLVQEVWLIPTQRLSLGATMSMMARAFITDQDGESLDSESWTFTVRGADEVGSLAGVGIFSDMVAHKGVLYAVEKLRETVADSSGYEISGAPVQAIRMIDATDPSTPKLGPSFGPHGSWDPMGPGSTYWATNEPFYKHEINGLRIAAGVGIGGKIRDLLLVTSRPRMTTELFVWSSDGDNTYRSRHNTMWVFDITGDEASFGENRTPKLLMCSSLGTLSENWGKGLGSAGGVLGLVRLRGGLTMWNADAWFNGFMGDANQLSVQALARRARMDKGYYPDPATVVASNGLYDPAAEPKQSVTSAVVTEDDHGRPIAFATMGYSAGMLVVIDGKVGDPMAKATFDAGGPNGLDSRIQDLRFAVDREPAHLVEAFKGVWTGANGTQQGILLLAATEVAGKGKLWVLNPKVSQNEAGIPNVLRLAWAELPARITKIKTDPAKMLVGVQAGGRAYVFDLKSLTPSSNGPMTLMPIYEFAVSGAWMIENGILYQGLLEQKRLLVRCIDAQKVEPMIGMPVRVDMKPFLAGLFMDFNKKVMNNPSAPPVLAPDDKLVYLMTRAYGQNNGYPWLRYFYPDLGPMAITGMVEHTDPNIFLEMTTGSAQKPSPWFMEAEAVLMGPNGPIPDAIEIQAMTIVRADQGDRADLLGTNRSPIYGDGERAKLELEAENSPVPGSVDWAKYREQKFAYAPFQFSIKRDVLTRLDAEMRKDERESYRVKVTLKLYRGKEAHSRGESEGFAKPYEFAVKFNTNTRLFDIARGGVWTFDPSVSGADPFDTGQNPFTAAWFAAADKDQGLGESTIMAAFNGRLSLTPLQTAPGAVISNIPSLTQEFKLPDMGLDLVQGCLEQALVGLRQQVIKDGDKHRQLPMPMAHRGTFLQPSEDADLGQQSVKGDVPGAYGYRTAHAVNAIQELGKHESGVGLVRDMADPRFWQTDPGAFHNDAARGVDARIMPVVPQGFRKKDGTHNPGNTLVHYLVAYPDLRKQGNHDNGLYPINTVLTRDLVFGPTPDWEDPDVQYWASKQSVDLITFQAQREEVDKLLRAINALPGRSDAAFDSARSEELFGSLKDSLLRQDIIIDRGAQTAGTGRFFNGAIGLLQLGLNPNWDRRRMDLSAPSSYVPNANSNILEVAESVPKSTGDDLRKSSEYIIIHRKIFDFLMNHLHARRLDVYINGVQNLPVELDDSVDRLQKKLLELEFPEPTERELKADQVPVLGVYNVSSKLYSGGTDPFFEKFDWWDLVTQKWDTALPWWPTLNEDTRRLAATLTAATDVLWNNGGFEAAFLAANRDPLDPDAARKALERLRLRLTVHAHSQGAIISASAQHRLGTFGIGLPDVRARIAGAWDLVTYGGGANMYDFGSEPYFKSYTHHVNENDAIAHWVGMSDPFQKKVGAGLGLLQATPVTLAIPVAGPIIHFHPHARAIALPTPAALKTAYQRYHRVIRFNSHCPGKNTAEHNFVNGYLCHVGMDPDGLPLVNDFSINEKSGGDYCLIAAPGPNPWIDCTR